MDYFIKENKYGKFDLIKKIYTDKIIETIIIGGDNFNKPKQAQNYFNVITMSSNIKLYIQKKRKEK